MMGQFYVPGFNGGKSQGQSSFLGGGLDYATINLMKTGGAIQLFSGGNPPPASLNSYGYPGTSQGGGWLIFAPGQTERPGEQVISWTGQAKIHVFYQLYGTTTTEVSCTGSYSSGACDNTGCSAFTGSISGKTLTVTVAPTGTGCALQVGEPISPAAVSVLSDAPTIITALGSGSGGVGTYSVNINQTVPSQSLQGGGLYVFQPVGADETNPYVEWWVYIDGTNPQTVGNLGFYHINDATLYAGGEIWGTLFRSRVSSGGFGVYRDLNWVNANNQNCTTWNTRLSPHYVSWGGTEMRPSLYAGTLTYTLNGSSNDYSITLPSTYVNNVNGGYTGGPVDKQLVIATIPTGGGSTNTTITLNVNGSGAVTVTGVGAETPSQTATGATGLFMYDAGLNEWIMQGATGSDAFEGVNCGMPPEVFLQFTQEMHLHPWFVLPYLSLDPMTDFTKQLAAYVVANQPSWMVARYEPADEPWNFSSLLTCYLSAKSYFNWGVTANIHCGSQGDITEEEGKYNSTVGQDVAAAYGGYSATKYKVIDAIQTAYATSGQPTIFDASLASTSYLAQSAPAQSGYTKSAALNWVTGSTLANYWSPTHQGTQAEVADAYNYSVSPLTATMNTYVGYNSASYSAPTANVVAWLGNYGLSQVDPYEGGFNLGGTPYLNGDVTVAITSATASGANCIMGTAAGNGAGGVAGQTIYLSAAAGTGSGTAWSSIVGSGNTYTVQSASTNSITINLNCSAFQTFSSATLDYDGSKTYVNAIRSASYSSQAVGTQNLQIYDNIVANGGEFPSMFQLATGSWGVWQPDIYGATNSATDPGSPQWIAIAAFNAGFLLQGDLHRGAPANDKDDIPLGQIGKAA
jgi:hypothetical protein